MLLTISIGLFSLAFFHFLTHALLRLYYLCELGVLFILYGILKLFILWVVYLLSIYMPFTSSSLRVSNFALCGIPFLSGFYSRDFILEMFSMRYVNMRVPSVSYGRYTYGTVNMNQRVLPAVRYT